MRLISCHIVNFGNLNNTDIDFNEGLNLIIRNNGWGKSTLAAFIRAMFYGLEGEGKKDVLSSERKRFAPWQGGVFGGNLCFEAKGKTLIITRIFKAKASEDEFELRDAITNLPSLDYSQRVGEELFGINSESFMRTIFIGQDDCMNAGATDDINAKLGNITDGIDLNRYAQCEDTLKNAMNSLSATRKTGEIARLKVKLTEIRGEIALEGDIETRLSDATQSVGVLRKSIDSLQEDLRRLRDKKDLKAKEAASQAAYESDEEHLRELKEALRSKEKELEQRSARFLAGVPSKEERRQIDKMAVSLTDKADLLDKRKLSQEEKRRYEFLYNLFSKKLPSTETLLSLLDKASKLEELKARKAVAGLSDKEKDKLEFFSENYGDCKSAEEDLEKASESIKERKHLEREANHLSEMSDASFRPAKGRGTATKAILRIFFGILFIMAGLGLLIYEGTGQDLSYYKFYLYASAVLVIIGVFLSLTGLSAKKRFYKDAQAEYGDNRLLGKKLSELDKLMNAEDVFLENVLDKYGFSYDSETCIDTLRSFKEELSEYRALLLKEEALMCLSSGDRIEDSFEIKQELDSFLSAYIFVETEEIDYRATLIDLMEKRNEYESLLVRMQEYETAVKEYSSLHKLLENLLYSISDEPFSDVYERAEEILDIVAEYDSLLTLHTEARRQLEAFSLYMKDKWPDVYKGTDMEKHKLLVDFDDLTRAESELEKEIEDKRSKLEDEKKNLELLKERFERYTELLNEATALGEELEEKLHRLFLIEKTEVILSAAKERLTARYMEPLLINFAKYYEVLANDNAESYKLDANIRLTKESFGKQYGVGFFSRGYKDLTGFCMRLALADAMYEKEKPFLILDDPFVNLDNDKLEGAQRLLDMVAEKHQILYFTCR